MAIEVEAPDGSIVEFPDGTSTDVMARAMRQKFGDPSNPTQNKTSATEAILRGVGQGLTFGFGDEIVGGVRALGNKVMDPSKAIGDLYDEAVGDERTRNTAASEEHPIAYYGSEVGSGLLVPGGLARVGIQSAVRNAAGQGLKARMAAGAKEGAAYGAAYGAGKSEGGIQERVEGALGGGGAGMVLGGAAPAVIDAAVSVAQPVVNTVRSVVRPQAEAARRVAQAMDDDIANRATSRSAQPLTQEEIQRNRTAANLIQQGRAGDDLRNVDVGGENVRALARSAANNSPEAREILQRSNDVRFEGQSGRTVDFLRGLVATPGNAPQTREALEAAAQRARAPAYQIAFRAGAGGITTPELRTLAQAPAMETAMRSALANIQNKAPGSAQRLQGPHGPTLEFWDQVTRELRDQVTTAQRTGAMEAARDLGQLRRRVIAELDGVVPEYRQARGVAQQFFQADDALEAGENFATRNFSRHEARTAIGNMSQAEQELFREGYISQIIQRADETGDRRSILSRIASSRDERERMEIALGPNRARELEAFMYLERVMDLARGAMGNSTTARQLTELGLAGGTGMLASGGNLTDPTTWIVGALTKYGAHKGLSEVDQNMARRIAQMLVSNDENAYRQAVQQVAHHGPSMQRLRGWIADYARMAGGAGAGRVGGSAMAQDDVEQEPLRVTVGRPRQ